MDLFPDPAPPLVPVFDAAAIWNAAEIVEIGIARENLRKKFPQFRVKVWSVDLPSNVSLPVFGFWLLNTCPFDTGESAENRSWTLLLLINAGTGHAAVIPGYSAERWLGDDDWKKILTSMGEKWRSNNPCASVLVFFESCADFLTISWNLRGRAQTRKTRS